MSNINVVESAYLELCKTPKNQFHADILRSEIHRLRYLSNERLETYRTLVGIERRSASEYEYDEDYMETFEHTSIFGVYSTLKAAQSKVVRLDKDRPDLWSRYITEHTIDFDSYQTQEGN